MSFYEKLVRAARKIARVWHTSVNKFAPGLLEATGAESRRYREATIQMEGFFRVMPYEIGDICWTRSELHDR
jgi:hypothetical protein